jgi:hypothetical protein
MLPKKKGMPQSVPVRADDDSARELAYEPDTVTRPTIGLEEDTSTLRLIATEGRLKPRAPPESQPRIGFTGASHF